MCLKQLHRFLSPVTDIIVPTLGFQYSLKFMKEKISIKIVLADKNGSVTYRK